VSSVSICLTSAALIDLVLQHQPHEIPQLSARVGSKTPPAVTANLTDRDGRDTDGTKTANTASCLCPFIDRMAIPAAGLKATHMSAQGNYFQKVGERKLFNRC